MKLPPLPDSTGFVYHEAEQYEPPWVSNEYAYTADQMEAYALAAVEAYKADLQREGWRQCAIGQKTTQFCAAAEKIRQETALQGIADFGQYEDWLRQTEEKVKAAREDEREQCEKICERRKQSYERRASMPAKVRDIDPEKARVACITCDQIAVAIRQRGKA